MFTSTACCRRNRGAWIEQQPFSVSVMRRWREAVLDGDLDRHLVPRNDGDMGEPRMSPRKHAASRRRVPELVEHEAEVARLTNPPTRGSELCVGKSYRALARDARARARRGEPGFEEFLAAENGLVRELIGFLKSQRESLKIAGLSRSTWHYRHSPQ